MPTTTPMTSPMPNGARPAEVDARRVRPDEVGSGVDHPSAPTTELMLVDVATGRYRPGDVIDVEVVVRELGTSRAEVRRAIDVLCRIGVLLRPPFGGVAVVGLHPLSTVTLLRRLGGAIESALTLGPLLEQLPEPQPQPTLADAYGLVMPADVERLVELARPLLTTFEPDEAARLEREVLDPLSVFASTAALRVHGSTPALGDDVRGRIVDLIESAAHYGDRRAIPGLVADHAIAFAPDLP